MPDWLQGLFDQGWFRYAIATTVGFIVAIAVERVSSRLEKRGLRRSVREALAIELIDNFDALDHWYSVMDRIAYGHEMVWPTSRLETSALAECLNVTALDVLSDDERMFVGIVLSDFRSANEAIERSLHRLNNAYHLYPEEAQNIKRNLPFYAMNALNLLIAVSERQDRYVHDRSMWVAACLLPCFDANRSEMPPRIWRTSMMLANQWSEGLMLAWHNDAPDTVPLGVDLVILCPPEDRQWGTVQYVGSSPEGMSGHIRSLARRARARRRRRTLKAWKQILSHQRRTDEQPLKSTETTSGPMS